MAAESARQGASTGLCRGIAAASSFVVGVTAWRAAGGIGGGVVRRMLRSVALVPPHPQTLSGPRRLVLTGCISASVFVGTYSLSQWVSSKLAPRTATADDVCFSSTRTFFNTVVSPNAAHLTGRRGIDRRRHRKRRGRSHAHAGSGGVHASV